MRGHVQMINELEEARGGNGGDILKLNAFMEYIDGLSNRELAVLNAYAENLMDMTGSMLKKREPPFLNLVKKKAE
jgi:hypothetical protein